MLRLGLSDKGEICQRVRPPFRGRLVGGARSFKWNQSLNRGSTKRNTSTCNDQIVLPNANQNLIYCSYTVIHCQTKSKTSILYFFIFTFANGLKMLENWDVFLRHRAKTLASKERGEETCGAHL